MPCLFPGYNLIVYLVTASRHLTRTDQSQLRIEIKDQSEESFYYFITGQSCHCQALEGDDLYLVTIFNLVSYYQLLTPLNISGQISLIFEDHMR